MTIFLYISVYASLACFLFGCLRRVRQYATLPVHLRWELYPVPHESPQRAAHGGSYFEETEWWTRPRKFHLIGELRVMAAEIFLFKSLWESNRKLWWRSFAFHSGLYCVVVSLLGQGALLVSGHSRVAFLESACVGVGWLGLGLMIVGGVSLLWRRMRDRELRDYTHLADVVHLVAIATAATLVLVGGAGPASPGLRAIMRGVFAFDRTMQLPPVLTCGLLLTCAIVAYVPYSQMAHFIAKYFTYHTVRWDDAPNVDGKCFAASTAECLNYKPSWSAAHIGADGAKSWSDIAAANPTQANEARR